MPVDRDIRQTQIGCMGFAILVHILLAIFILGGHSSALMEEPTGGESGAKPSAGTIVMDLNTDSDPLAAAPPAPSPADSGESSSTITVADSEIELPEKAEPKAEPPPPPPKKEEPKKAEAPKPVVKKAAEPKKSIAKKALPTKLPEKKAEAKSKSAKPKPVVVADDEDLPEVAADIPDFPIDADESESSNDSDSSDIEVPVIAKKAERTPPVASSSDLFKDEPVEDDLSDLEELTDETSVSSMTSGRGTGNAGNDLKALIREGEQEEKAALASGSLGEEIAAAESVSDEPVRSAGRRAEGLGSPTVGMGGMRNVGGNTSDGIPTNIRNDWELREAPGNRKPNYPREDQRNNRQGDVTFLAYVNADGTVKNVRIEKTTGSHLMNQEASQAMNRWRFLPGQQGWVRKTFNFRLTGEAQPDFSGLRQ